MKKVLTVIVVLFLVILMTGCGKEKTKTLVCNKRSSVDKAIIYEKIKMDYQKDKLISGKYTYTFTYLKNGEVYDEETTKAAEKELEKSCDDYKELFKKDHGMHYFEKTISECSAKVVTKKISKYGYELKHIITLKFDPDKVNKNKYTNRFWVLEEFEHSSHFKCEYK